MKIEKRLLTGRSIMAKIQTMELRSMNPFNEYIRRNRVCSFKGFFVMDEVWKPVPGFEGLYQVSSIGRVKGKTNLLSLKSKSSGYKRAGLKKDGKQYYKTVHSLVAEAFYGPRPENYCVAHLNGIKEDNRVENLKYCTYAENEAHKKEHGTYRAGENNHNAKLTNKQALAIQMIYYELPKHKKSLLADLFDVSMRTIKAAAHKTTYSACIEGYKPSEGWQPTHRHKKRGTDYQVIGDAILQCEEYPPFDDKRLILYRGEDGKYWVRPPAEFNDGRFEEIAAPKPEQK